MLSFRMKYGTAMMFLIVMASFLTAILLARRNTGQGYFNGDLKLIATNEPLQLAVYADTASTNLLPDLEVEERGRLLFRRDTDSSNHVEFTYAEKYMNVQTEWDSKGNVSRRYIFTFYTNAPGRTRYAYVDTNGSGMFDYLLEYGPDGKVLRVFWQSNFCWIPLPMPSFDKIKTNDANH